MLPPLGAVIGGLLVVSDPAREAARFTGRHFCGSRGTSGGIVRVVRCADCRRLGCHAGGCHETREGNTDRSTHWHCIVSFGWASPLAARKRFALPHANNIGEARKCRSESARLCLMGPGMK